MKNIIIVLTLLISPLFLAAQNYSTNAGTAKFHSATPIEDIDAVNNQLVAVLNTENGNLTFALLIKSFQFKKALMQEHFNENYLESDDYPKAVFKGAILNYKPLNLDKKGKVDVKVAGKLTIHGVTTDITADATLTIKERSIEGFSKFIVKPEDYRIRIPHTVRNNIAKEIEVTIQAELNPQ